MTAPSLHNCDTAAKHYTPEGLTLVEAQALVGMYIDFSWDDYSGNEQGMAGTVVDVMQDNVYDTHGELSDSVIWIGVDYGYAIDASEVTRWHECREKQ